MKIVTEPIIGLKVIRGRDWRWGNQDHGSKYGEIYASTFSGWARVKWYNEEGKSLDFNSYRVGAQGSYDLYYYEGTDNDIVIIKSHKKKKNIITDIPQFFSKPV